MPSSPRLVLLSVLFAAPVLAQLPPTATPGFRAEGVFDFSGGIDQVSLFNGALTAQVPLGQLQLVAQSLLDELNSALGGGL